jgi:hypothetical protein
LIQQPTTPSAEDIAHQEFHLIEEYFAQALEQLAAGNTKIANLTTMNTWLSVIALILACITFVLLFAYLRIRRGPG